MRFLLALFLAIPAFAEPGDAFSMSSAFKKGDIAVFNEQYMLDEVLLVFGTDRDIIMFYDEASGNELEWKDAGGNWLMTLTDAGSSGNINISGAFQVGGNSIFTGTLDLQDDKAIKFGDGDDFLFDFDSGNTRLELNDAAGQIMLHITDTGTKATLAVSQDITAERFGSGQGLTEVHLMDQNIREEDAVIFASVNTGFGANELYDMNQHVLTTSAVTFEDINITTGGIVVLNPDSGEGVKVWESDGGFIGGEIVGSATDGRINLYDGGTAGLLLTGGGIITSPLGAIGFGDDNLSTTGTFASGAATFTSESVLINYATTDAAKDGPILYLRRTDAGVGGDEGIGQIIFQGTDGGTAPTGRIFSESGGAHSVSSKRSDLVFEVTQSGEVATTEVLRLNNDLSATFAGDVDIIHAGNNSFNVESTDGHAISIVDAHTSFDGQYRFYEAGTPKFRVQYDGGTEELNFYADDSDLTTAIIDEPTGKWTFNYDATVLGGFTVGSTGTETMTISGHQTNLVMMDLSSSAPDYRFHNDINSGAPVGFSLQQDVGSDGTFEVDDVMIVDSNADVTFGYDVNVTGALIATQLVVEQPLTHIYVASGALAPAGYTFIKVRGEGTAPDTVTSISAPTGGEGTIIILELYHSSDNITFTDNDGTLNLADSAANFVLEGYADKLVLIYDGTNWEELSRSDNAT